MAYPKFKVCCRCFTFNQSHYITDAMNGFCMQETTFPFVCCIVDDASTDGEQNVINRYVEEHFNVSDNAVAYKKETDYAHISFAQHKENNNCYFAVVLLKENLYSKREGYKKFHYISEWRDFCEYEAMCEGDDYWIDPKKIQNQAEFLDNNPDYGLVRTNIDRFYQDTMTFEKSFFQNSRIKDNLSDYIMNSWFAAPCTWMYRLDMFKFPPLDPQIYFTGDLLMLLHFASVKKIYYLAKVTAVYRILENSSSHFENSLQYYRFWQKCKNTRLYYAMNQSLLFRLKYWAINSIFRNVYFSRQSINLLLNVPKIAIVDLFTLLKPVSSDEI